MKKFFTELVKSFLILFILFTVTFLYYLYIPSSAKKLDNQINLSDPSQLDQTRLDLSSKLAQYLADGLPKDSDKTPTLLHLFLANQRKLLDLRIKNAIGNIKNSPPQEDQLHITATINMGVIAKTKNHTIAFDIADMPTSVAQKKLTTVADIFLVTHMDSDHYDFLLLKKALDQGKTVIFPAGFNFFYDSKNYSNIHKLSNGQTVDINGVKITAYQTDHRMDGDFDNSNAWYLVDVDGFKILHTGDGIEFKDRGLRQKLNQTKDIDVFFVNAKIHPYDIRDIHPKLAIPLHLFKFMHNHQELSQSTFSSVADTYNQHSSDLKNIDIKFLFPGESIDYIYLDS